jgi:hypothetical protein
MHSIQQSWFDFTSSELLNLKRPFCASYKHKKNLLGFIAQTHFITDVSTGRACN